MGEVNDRLTSLSLYSKAERGVGLTHNEIENFRKSLKEYGNIFSDKSQGLAFDRSLVSMSQDGNLLVQDKKLLKSAFESETEKLTSEVVISHKAEQNQVGRNRNVSKQLQR